MTDFIELTYADYDREEEEYVSEGVASIWIEIAAIKAVVGEAPGRPAELLLENGESIFVAEPARTFMKTLDNAKRQSREKWWLKH
jgi:hypothetical protein